MSKKQVKSKAVKKAVKPAKKAAPAKKGKPAKAVNSSKPKKASKPVKKAAVKKAAKKVVSKKTIIKKAVKPAKKVLKKVVKPLKAKPVKKAVAKKTVTKAKPAPKKKIASKPARPAAKAVKTVTKPVKAAREKAPVKTKEKEPLKVTPVVATLKSGKPAKAESPKPLKAEKPRRAKKAKKAKDDEDEPAIENDPLIEEIIRSTKKKQQQPKKPKIIQTFVNPMASLAVAAPLDSGKKASVPKKEPKGKFELEYVVRTSAGILYEFLTSPSGLSEWFADDVNIRDGIFTFFWDGSEQKARLINFKDEKYVRMQWVDKPEGTYFEFRIEKDELTGDVSLMIIDFADEGSDLETSKRLWDTQVNKLLHVIGSY